MHERWRRITVVLGLVVCATPTVLMHAQGPVFRSDTNVVVMQVTVTGPASDIDNLTPEDFTVFEDGRPQPVTFFTRERAPLALSLLLDTSDSMDASLPLAQTAAIELTHRLGPADLAEVVAFNGHVRVLQPFTRPSEVAGAIRQTSASGTTSLYNALYVALKEFDAVQPSEGRMRRHAIVLLSDGEDTSSLMGFDDVFDLARRSNVSIYTIRLGEAPVSLPNRMPNEGRAVLQQFARATGGRAIFVERPSELLPIYGQIADELTRQYTLAYTPPAAHRDGKWHDLAVRIERPNCAARTRTGYLASH